jgi:DNA-binding CsgD family transcriptional regulator
VQPSSPLSVVVQASDELLHKLVSGMVTQAGFALIERYQPGAVYLVVDNPLCWAFNALEALPKRERRFAVVSTQVRHPVYTDCLMSYQLSSVFFHTDAARGIAALYAAAAGATSTTMTSGLTPSELRIVRLLLQGHETREIARKVRAAEKTVNAHISNVLGKLGYKDRAQLVAKVLGYCPE